MHYLDHYATIRGRYALTLLLSVGALLAAGLALALLTAGCKTATLGQVITPARVETVTALGAYYGAHEAIAKGHRPEVERARAGLAAMALRRALLAEFEDDSDITICGAWHNLDTETNYSPTTAAISARNSNTETVQTDLIHPGASGYYQVMDSIKCALKCQET